MSKSFRSDKILLGACYYPEHWPESLWEDDFRRMREMGFSLVRMGEFAWNFFEPEEGVFSFDFFRRALDAAHAHGLRVVLGTPTATPPAWLTEKYPEVLNATLEGVLYRHGQRRHYNYSSPAYRRFCARIVREMAEAYKDHPAIVGWQIDNELNCETNVFYAEADHRAFREWCRRKYGTLEKMNEAWGAVFWNQTYTDWEQVHLPRPTPSDSPNPHQALDEKRFISDNAVSFAKLQADILRECAPRHWITTNGLFGHLDNHRLTEEALDFISYDSYPQFAALEPDDEERSLRDRRWGLSLSGARSVSPTFCVMEQQSGPGGWVNRIEQPSPKPGQLRLWTYQSIAHGADAVLYFRWRTATVGTEIYWHGLNDYHNGDNRRLREAARVGRELAKIGALAAGKPYRARVGILHDYANEWDGEMDNWHGPLTRYSRVSWYKTLQGRHIPVDLVHLNADTDLGALDRYDLLIYPHPAILTDAAVRLLERYASNGGQLVFGCRTGYKNEHGHCYFGRPFPGPAAELCGITVEDFTLIKGKVPPPPVILRGAGGEAETTGVLFNDIIRVEASDVQVLGTYAGSYYDGKPILTRRPVGKGGVWYYGAAFTSSAADFILSELGLPSASAGWADLAESVELAIRGDDGSEIAFLLNYADAPATVSFRREVRDLLDDRTLVGAVVLEPFGILIVDPSPRAAAIGE